ncbi:hypothetical protein BDV40DRAFT_283370 [Aspergillus tamarii]|uniref:Uncharacterized protein n=1 Tax=Aspergillus tamarii TaxID=41984 RepID=A0A5N6UAH7_ASPTM|nr:hypothetical protein BDV40DRAFT_283370 [Aspergillus tamarii]
MTYTQSNLLALQIFLEDLNTLKDRQQRSREFSDQELAIMYMEEDIIATQTSIEDRKLALSTSIAIATEQNILASLSNDENIAE